MLGAVGSQFRGRYRQTAPSRRVIATPVGADRDAVVIMPGAQDSQPDPSTAEGFVAKTGIDARIPFGTGPSRYERIRVPAAETVDPALIFDGRPAVAAL